MSGQLGRKRKPQEDAKNLGTKMGASDIPFASMQRVGRDEPTVEALIMRFMGMEDKITFLSKRRALKGDKIDLDDDVILT